MNEIKIFENEQLGKIRVVEIDKETWFVGKDVAEILGYTNNRKAIIDHVDNDDKTDGVTIRDSIGRKQRPTLINESGLYSLILSSKLSTAKDFKRWVTSEVLPAIRKTGGYIVNEDIFIENYLPFADESTKSMFKLNLQIITQQNKIIANQKEELKHQADVIEGFTDNITLADKRSRISQIIRYNTLSPIEVGKRWNLLYKEFEIKYHINLEARMISDKYRNINPKNKIDLIQRGLDMINELYEIACKLFESDYNNLLKEWSSIITKKECI